MKSLFDIPDKIVREISAPVKKKPTQNKGKNIKTSIDQIVAQVETHLGKYRDDYEIISDKNRLSEYISSAIEAGEISIDTETTGLNPMRDKLVGLCLYVPGHKAVYVPVGHVSYITGQKSKNQLEIDVVAHQIRRLADAGTKVIMFNATFDIRVIKNSLGVKLECYWDCYIAARCLNENEPVNRLKPLHSKYVLKGEEEELTFDEFFKDINFSLIPISTAYLYATHDAIITYELYEYQKQFLYYEPDEPNEDRNGMNGVAWVFFNIEMPCVAVVADMEDTGIDFDMEYNEHLKDKYHKILDDRMNDFITAYHMYDDEIAQYKGSVRFDEPINIKSVPQLQALLYDIIGLQGPKDKRTGEYSRSTDEETLKKLSSNAVAKAILDYREFATIVTTFIDKLPECVDEKDGRIHCHFNQYGADTGRFSSRDPNMQNIPSHNKEIRKMFKATDGYVIMSSDYSQQEVKGMAQMCQDEGMLQAFREGKDFYAEIAAVSFGKTYRECLEFQTNEDGSWVLDKEGDRVPYPDGKERRAQAKSILLGINYGRGATSIAEQLHCSKQKAEKIKEDVFEGFPAIERFEQESKYMAEDLGYVTTLWGRKRRLPVMRCNDYEFSYVGTSSVDDPLNFDDDIDEPEEVPYDVINSWTKRLNGTWGKRKNQIIAQARMEGLIIEDNTRARADATRQIVNSRIQGTAADMTKLAMIALYNDKRLNELGFRMLVPIHDEILAECPIENAAECKERFAKLMSEAPGDKFTIPISCDVEVSYCWYGDKVEV